MTRFLHWLGFHGQNWRPFWLRGNVWIECVICGARRLPPSEDMVSVPDNEIASRSRFIGAVSLAAMLAGCADLSASVSGPPDPTVKAKIVSLCLYSGAFKAANSQAGQISGLIPVPGAGTIGTVLTSLGNAAVTDICTNPDKYAGDITVVEGLFNSFKSAGKM